MQSETASRQNIVAEIEKRKTSEDPIERMIGRLTEQVLLPYVDFLDQESRLREASPPQVVHASIQGFAQLSALIATTLCRSECTKELIGTMVAQYGIELVKGVNSAEEFNKGRSQNRSIN